MPSKTSPDSFTELGYAVVRKLGPAVYDPHSPWVHSCWVLPVLVVLLVVAMYFGRDVDLGYSKPKIFNRLNHALMAPGLVLLAGAWGVLGAWVVSGAGPREFSGFRLLTAAQAPQAIGIGVILAACAVLWGITRMMREKVETGIHGGASWAARPEIVCAREDAPQNRNRLAWVLPVEVAHRGNKKRWNSWLGGFFGGAGLVAVGPTKESKNRHLRILGPSGSGKGYFLLGHILKSARCGVIYQDFKAECPCFRQMMEKLGKPPIRWGAGRPNSWPSLAWNPIEECRNDPAPRDAFLALASAIMVVDSGSGAEGWVTKLGRPILAQVFASGDYPTIAHLADRMAAEGIMTVLGLEMGEDGKLIYTGIASELKGLVSSVAEGKNVKEYLTTDLYAALDQFRSGWGREVTSRHDFGLDQLLDEGGYVLSNETVASSRLPLQVFWRMIIRRILKRDAMDTLLILDEGLAAGEIPHLSDALNTTRSLGVGFIFVHQTTGGLQEVYRQSTAAVKQSFASTITLLNGMTSDEDVEELQKRYGTYTHRQKSSSTKGSSGSVVAAPLFTKDDIRRRASSERDRWAILEVMGASKEGRPILCQLVPSTWDTTPPSADELQMVEATAKASVDPTPETVLALPQKGGHPNPAEISRPSELNLGFDPDRTGHGQGDEEPPEDMDFSGPTDEDATNPGTPPEDLPEWLRNQ